MSEPTTHLWPTESGHRLAPKRCAELMPTDADCDCGERQYQRVLFDEARASQPLTLSAERLRSALADLLWWHEWVQREDAFTADLADTEEEAERRHQLWQTFMDHTRTAEFLRAALG